MPVDVGADLGDQLREWPGGFGATGRARREREPEGGNT